MKKFQDLAAFRVPPNFRGRSAVFVQVWWFVQATFFAASPQFAYGWRRFLLRMFGAKIGDGVLVRPSARVTYPWKVSIGAFSWVGDHATLYSLDAINIGQHCCISQHAYLATAGHDFSILSFDYVTGPINIADEVWIAAGVIIMPSVTIGRGAVAAAGAVVTRDISDATIVAGVPAREIRKRLPSRVKTDTDPLQHVTAQKA